jgi:hypothetical protein
MQKLNLTVDFADKKNVRVLGFTQRQLWSNNK